MKTKFLTKISGFFKNDNSCKDIDIVNSSTETEEFERCVMCGELTGIPVSMPIDWRENYEIGCGQLCVKCAKKQQ
jgi:hypothetical protein